MSKSLRNVVDPLRLKWEFGNDGVRYYLMRDNVFGLDGDFNHEAFIGRINSDLANDLGNLLSRTAALAHKFSGGRIPERSEGGEAEAGLRACAVETAARAGEAFHEARFSAALEAIWHLCAEANRYIDFRKPWEHGKRGDGGEVAANLYHGLETCRWLAHMIAPVMPRKAREMQKLLGVEPSPMDREAPWPSKWGMSPEGAELPGVTRLFPRLDEKAIASVLASVAAAPDGASVPDGASAKADEAAPAEKKKEEDPGDGLLSIDDFRRMKLVVGIVRECESLPKSDKLLRLLVDTGEEEPRTLVAGIAAHYGPEQLLGKRVVIVENLRPAKIRGVLSRGMVLAAESEDGGVAVLTVEKDVKAGSPVR
jgi:methionyl-tRNA synthetase